MIDSITLVTTKLPSVIPTVKGVKKVQRLTAFGESLSKLIVVCVPQIAVLQVVSDTISYASDVISVISLHDCSTLIKKWRQSEGKTVLSCAIMVSKVTRKLLVKISKMDIDFGTISTAIGNVPVLSLVLSGMRVVHSLHAIWTEWGNISAINKQIASKINDPEATANLLDKRAVSYNKCIGATNRLIWGIIRIASVCIGIDFFGPVLSALGKLYLSTYNFIELSPKKNEELAKSS